MSICNPSEIDQCLEDVGWIVPQIWEHIAFNIESTSYQQHLVRIFWELKLQIPKALAPHRLQLLRVRCVNGMRAHGIHADRTVSMRERHGRAGAAARFRGAPVAFVAGVIVESPCGRPCSPLEAPVEALVARKWKQYSPWGLIPGIAPPTKKHVYT